MRQSGSPAGGPLAWAFALPRSQIRWKIIAPYVVLVLLLAALGTYLATKFVTSSLDDRFSNQLAEAARVTSDSLVRRERQHLSVVRAIAFTEGIAEAAEANDANALNRLVLPLAANNRAEYVEVLDAAGRRIVGLHLSDPSTLRYAPIDDDANRANLAAVTRVKERFTDATGDKFTQIVQLRQGLAIYTAGPMLLDKRLAGIVVVGSRLDAFLAAAKTEALADITVYDFDGRALGSTFVGDTPGDGSGAKRVGFRETHEVNGRKYDLLYGDMRLRNESVGTFSIALPSSFISNAGRTTRVGTALLFGSLTLAVLGVGLLVARAVTTPLLRLVRTARSVTEGDLTARSGVTGTDEVGVLAASFDAMTERLAQQHLSTIQALTSAIDARDPYTAGHSIRVGQLSMEIGRALALPDRDLQFLEVGGYLHDVGKIGVRDNILLKAGELTPEERRLIEEHPRIGLRIVERVNLADEVLQVVGQHHEKLDGSGYPYGLTGERLTMFPRISAVADFYDALSTDRPYRAAMPVDRIMAILRAEVAAGHFDPLVIQAFFGILPYWERRRRTETSLQGLQLPELAFERLGA
jgi:putative nucleotidyltransferase with HDIG domain